MPSLDIGANSLRQNGSIKDDHALVGAHSAPPTSWSG